MQLLSLSATIFKKKSALRNIKNCPKKLLIIPLDQEFLVQQVFGLCGTETVFSLLNLIFEDGKLSWRNSESRTRT